MKMNLLRAAVAATAIVGLSGAALAQATGPTPQDNTKMNKDKRHMSKGGMKAGNTMAPATSGANTTGPAAQKSMTAPAEPKAK